MRILIAAALFVLALTGFAPAHAADLGWRPGAFAGIAERAEPVVIYDYEPGVEMRAYWRAPWRHRHYFPATGTKPEVGRDENTSGDRSKPAEDYYRRWSTSVLINRTLSGIPPELDRFGPPPQK